MSELLAIGLAANHIEHRLIRWVAACVLAGMLLFSGSLYALTFGAPRWVGVVTPLGGLALILGWTTFATGVISRRQ